MTLVARTRARVRVRPFHLLVVVLAGLLLATGSLVVARAMQPQRTTPVYDPPVLAGQQLWGACAGGFYARHGDTIVLTSTGHCTREGTVAYDPDGTTVRGVFGPAARDASCPYPGHTCAASDLNYLVVAPDRIPWGHLNVVDLGTAGYRVIEPGTKPLACADIAIGDLVEIDGRNLYRSGTVAEKGDNLHPGDGAYFPCMIAARIPVGSGIGRCGPRAGNPGGRLESQLRRVARVHAPGRGAGRAGAGALHHARLRAGAARGRSGGTRPVITPHPPPPRRGRGPPERAARGSSAVRWRRNCPGPAPVSPRAMGGENAVRPGAAPPR